MYSPQRENIIANLQDYRRMKKEYGETIEMLNKELAITCTSTKQYKVIYDELTDVYESYRKIQEYISAYEFQLEKLKEKERAM